MAARLTDSSCWGSVEPRTLRSIVGTAGIVTGFEVLVTRHM
jgi:hypothetical protein